VNGTPTGGFTYGTGNNYNPANTVVFQSGDPTTASGAELALRWHLRGAVAPAAVGNGVYVFALGTNPLSFDWSLIGSQNNALITLTNIGTGAFVSYNPFFPGNDNTTNVSGAFQNSANTSFAFLSGLGFNPNVNDTYRATFSANGNSVTAFAQFGTGAVPEPATWLMMIFGFGIVGFGLRTSKRHTVKVTYA
jgi:hypothetical protein